MSGTRKIAAGLERVRETLRNAEDISPDPASLGKVRHSPGYKPAAGSADLSKLSDLSRLSELSNLSVSPFLNPTWTALQRDLFEERAAILEFDGGMQRRTAEYLARRIVDESLL